MARTPKIVEDRREQIIDAAMHVFAQKGFTKATNKDVAREAGITPGLIYYYFESKEALLMAIVENRSPLKLVGTIPAEVFAQPPEVFLRFLARRVLDIVESENFIGLMRVLLPEVLHGDNPALAQLVPGVIQRILGFIGTFLEKKMASGELRQADVALTAQIFIGSMMAFVLRRQIIRDPVALAYTQEQVVDSVVETFLQGMLPR
jgi:AcrR family transcriptional regulator